MRPLTFAFHVLIGSFVSAQNVEQPIRNSGKAFLKEPALTVQPAFRGRGGRDIVTARDGRVAVLHGHSLRESADGGSTWSPPREVGPDEGCKAEVDETNGEILYIRI